MDVLPRNWCESLAVAFAYQLSSPEMIGKVLESIGLGGVPQQDQRNWGSNLGKGEMRGTTACRRSKQQHEMIIHANNSTTLSWKYLNVSETCPIHDCRINALISRTIKTAAWRKNKENLLASIQYGIVKIQLNRARARAKQHNIDYAARDVSKKIFALDIHIRVGPLIERQIVLGAARQLMWERAWNVKRLLSKQTHNRASIFRSVCRKAIWLYEAYLGAPFIRIAFTGPSSTSANFCFNEAAVPFKTIGSIFMRCVLAFGFEMNRNSWTRQMLVCLLIWMRTRLFGELKGIVRCSVVVKMCHIEWATVAETLDAQWAHIR